MVAKLAARKKREYESIQNPKGVTPVSNDQVVSDTALFAQLGGKLKVNKPS